MKIQIHDAVNKPGELQKRQIAKFLHRSLGHYGDPLDQITQALSYALQENNPFGGFILTLVEEDNYVGALVVNKTGMSGYIPENILVYIAVDPQRRGEGVGQKLVARAIEHCKGDIALHVEQDNPAKFLYEKMGFTNPFLEMRYKS